MSFSSQAREELCRVPIQRDCCAAAELYGALLCANTFSAREVRVVTALPELARRLNRLLRRCFGFEFETAAGAGERSRSVLRLRNPERVRAVFNRFGYEPETLLAHHVNLGVLEESHCRAAFFRGAFLAGGSVADPARRWHLELVTDHRNVAGEALALLLEMGFAPGNTQRGGRYVLYLKKHEAIEEFLGIIGATGAAMEVMNAQIEREMRNRVNRALNCDSANADRIVEAAAKQREKIRALDLDALPPELRELALLRIANPAASLTDLASLSDPPLSRSAVNHRMRKLMAWGEE